MDGQARSFVSSEPPIICRPFGARTTGRSPGPSPGPTPDPPRAHPGPPASHLGSRRRAGSGAFCLGDLQEDVYVDIPPGYRSGNSGHRADFYFLEQTARVPPQAPRGNFFIPLRFPARAGYGGGGSVALPRAWLRGGGGGGAAKNKKRSIFRR
jgi:hypothetical protein